MTTRIYIVRESGTDTPLLIRATSQAQAIRHASRTIFTAEVATQDDIVTAMQAGVTVEDATKTTTTEEE